MGVIKLKNKRKVIEILYNNLPCICDITKPLPPSKYVDIAKKFQLRNYKLCLTSDILKLGLMDELTKYQKEFIISAGACVAIFNTMNDKPISMVFRALTKKEFMDISVCYCAYGFDLIDENFKYGDWLLITEGIYDSDCVRSIYKNSVAMLTSNITVMQAQILKSLTNRFIIAFDNDSAGDSGYKKTLKRLKGSVIQKLNMYGSDKDLGVMCEGGFHTEGFSRRREYYDDEIQYIIENN